MTNKTFSKILSFGIAAVLITTAIIMSVYYVYYDKQAKENLQTVSNVVSAQINREGKYDFVKDIDYNYARITVIDSDGTVLLDNQEDESKMENYSKRPEVQEALMRGEGSNIRKSATVDENTYYFAKLLKDGKVLRVAVTAQTILSVFYSSLYYVAFAILAVIIASLAMSMAITKSIVKPIEKMGENLDEAENYCPYEELQPFVENIKDQKEKQKKIDKQKKQFTANVSHELKTPLTSIAGYAELIENGIAKPEDITTFASTIRKQALRLVSLTEDIIQLSQLDETDNNEVVMENIDLFECAKNSFDALMVNAKKKNVIFNLDGSSKMINGNESLVNELIYNLCDNAIKYNKDGGRVDVLVAENENGRAFVEVKDTGIGIPKKYENMIFERFFRVDKSRSKETGGTGLGLAIVKHIAEVHGATINVKSAENEGTDITVTFK